MSPQELLPLLPKKLEFEERIKRLCESASAACGDWDAVFIVDKLNQYYLTGTIQDGLFVLLPDGSHAYFVRRSIERARLECQVSDVYPMTSYREVKEHLAGRGSRPVQKVLLETEVVTYAMLERLKRHFALVEVLPVDRIMAKLRSQKSPYELAWIEESGRQHAYLLETIVPEVLFEGQNEADFVAELYARMVKLGYHGVSRFGMFQTTLVVGQVGFGENSIYPTCFDGPGGMKGLCPAVPIVGDRQRRLQKGDLVFVDIGYGVNGYHSDRTQVYMFGAQPAPELVAAHRRCRDVQSLVAGLLRPGNIPSEVYKTAMDSLEPSFLENFMGFGTRTVSFLGHGVGLQIDEYPVISKGFDEPFEEGMVMAVEPKKGLPGIGMVGVEDTYVVTPTGGRCITGGEKEIIVI
ncbi:MAG: Xaa-Pro peptidase family protein [Coriobacteriia bacterium]|nr:Xaa-Pro peptidase family protein [Coriobacteriia bacterium]